MEEDVAAFSGFYDPDIKSPTAAEEESALNISHSTNESSQEGSVSNESAHKLEIDSMAGAKAAYFDITAQMNQLIDGDNDFSFWFAQGFHNWPE